MLSWLLLRISISAALISTVDPNCTDRALSFKVKRAELTFNTKNAKKFLSCLCNTIYGCEFRVNNTHGKIDIISAKPTSATVTSLSNVFTCSYSQYVPELIWCELIVHITIGQCVTSLKETGCNQIFNTINCRAESVSLTWNQPYTVTCQLIHETFHVNSTCIDDKNINYTIKDCQGGANHISSNNREPFNKYPSVSGVHSIESITENNWITIVSVTVSLGVLLFIFF